MSEKLKIATNSHFLEKTSHMTSYIGHFRWAKTTISEKILIQISCPIFSDQYIPHPTIYLIRIFIINCKKTQRFRSLLKNRRENQISDKRRFYEKKSRKFRTFLTPRLAFVQLLNPLPLGSRNSICNFKQINFSEFSLDLIEVK